MHTSIGKPCLVILVFLALPASAQERKAIDVFENQDDLPQGALQIEGADGESLHSDGDPAWEGTSSGRTDGGLRLRYERNGASILVPADIEGRRVYFVFDTGATYTTLTGDFAQAAGIFPKKSYPATMTRTAGGPRATQFGLINSLRIGGRNHGGVSFTICGPCAGGLYKGKPVVGLLGMNVIGRYRTSFDDAEGVIEMVPTRSYMDRARDIQPWIRVQYDDGVRAGKSLHFDGRVTNNSPRTIQKMTLRFRCADGQPVDVSRKVGPGKTAKFRTAVESGDCREDFDARVVESRW